VHLKLVYNYKDLDHLVGGNSCLRAFEEIVEERKGKM
jgi:hypothetical protein